MLEGALILLAGFVVGRFMPGRRRKPKPPKPIKPICGCGHGYHDHGAESGACHGQKKKYRHDGLSEVMDGYMPCTCQRYTGPTPLPEFYAPEITS
jgi:hypothetical protein